MAKINISMSDDILAEIENKRKEKHLTRSGFLRKAFESYIRVLEDEKLEEEKKRGIEKAIELQNEIREKVGEYDFAEDLRKWREGRK
ncbi:MAG: ribbon-helix-helix protein, CopG family [bacterium]